MRKVFLLLAIFLASVILLFTYSRFSKNPSSLPSLPQQNNKISQTESDTPLMTIIAENLDTPWGIAILPDNSMLVTERSGRIRLIDNKGNLDEKIVATLENVEEIGEGGLLGIALHPDFSSNNYIYLYYTYSSSGNNTLNRVVRTTYKNKQLTDEQVIVDRIPGNANHNGGRIKFEPASTSYLYITTGDAQNPSLAQDRNSLAGKILRVTDQGMPASGRPFNNLVYSYGHRNSQGLAWDSNGQLWATEHGRSGAQSGLDELNLIEMGKNYGWPIIQGDQTQGSMEPPRLHSGSDTWAPAGAAFAGKSLFFGGLRGEALYEVDTESTPLTLKEHFKGELGRIREVISDSSGMLYITTSNRDGRGSPQITDDRVIRINPAKL